MTNSETRTDSRKQARKKQAKRKGVKGTREPLADARRDIEKDSRAAAEERPSLSPRVMWIGMALLLVGGWIGIMEINRWYFGPPVFFLCTGWLAILLTGRFLWNAGMAAAEEDDGTLEEEFWRAEGPADELQREKRSLLKAIKEIEFDREMGKMSDLDAKELTHFYRTRAIQIIKALERVGDESELTIGDKIDRELKARMSIAHASAKGKAAAKAKEAKGKDGKAKAKAKEAKVKDAKEAKAKDSESPAAKARKAELDAMAESEAKREAASAPEASSNGADSGETAEKAGNGEAAKADTETAADGDGSASDVDTEAKPDTAAAVATDVAMVEMTNANQPERQKAEVGS